MVKNKGSYLITDTTTNITIQKMTEIIESNIVLDDTYDEVVTQFIINFKYILIVVEPGFPFRNTPHYTSLVF